MFVSAVSHRMPWVDHRSPRISPDLSSYAFHMCTFKEALHNERGDVFVPVK